MKKQIIIIDGPSGAGKDSIFRELIKNEPNKYQKIVSLTDRPMRAGEVDGELYFFVTTEEFEQKIATGEVFEYTKRHEKYRGMSKKLIDYILKNGKIAIKDCDYVGVLALKRLYPGRVLSIFINTDREKIIQRIKNRGDSDMDARISDYDNHIKTMKYYDIVLENNGTLDEIVKKVQSIIDTHI